MVRNPVFGSARNVGAMQHVIISPGLLRSDDGFPQERNCLSRQREIIGVAVAVVVVVVASTISFGRKVNDPVRDIRV
jgi:hypothetical protein